MQRLALNTDLSPGANASPAPTRVMLIPSGPDVVGRDGRAWTFTQADAEALIASYRQRAADLPIDWEHATQHRAPEGEPAPAAGWITDLSLDQGALMAAVDWTPRAAEQISLREYRYLSPVFDFEPSTGRIVRLISAGLTNLPNLRLGALNQEHSAMTLSALLVAALGIPADATDDVAVAAINKLKAERDTAQAKNAEQVPSLDRYVPRADYDAVLARATNAEQSLRDRTAAEHKAAVDTAISEALKAGKITPATEAYHRASCQDAEGLKRFRDFVQAAPEIAATAPEKKPVADAATALNAEELAVCTATGIAPADFVKAKAA